jgi:hypothetical protein
MSGLFSLRARVMKLEAQRSTERAFIIVCSLPEDVDPATLACLPGAVTLVSTGVPRDPLDEGRRAPTVWEIAGDGHWFLLDPQDLAA